jgi:hypothetical protein
MTLLNYPYPRNIEEPNVYDTIRVHAEFSTAADHVKGPEFSVCIPMVQKNEHEFKLMLLVHIICIYFLALCQGQKELTILL